MGELINLKRFKKRAAREDAVHRAETNRARFGRKKAERDLDQRRKERSKELLDQHRIDGKDTP